MQIRDTKPLVAVYVDKPSPMFKTVKILGGRAVAMDSCARSTGSYGFQWQWKPGWGWYAHKDGYNVLYGDNHARWVGDGTQRILYYDDPISNYTNIYGTSYLNLMGSCIRYGDVKKAGAVEPNPLLRLWHEFDLADGLDVDAGVNDGN